VLTMGCDHFAHFRRDHRLLLRTYTTSSSSEGHSSDKYLGGG
jgi:hypothetical protein